MSSSNNSDPLEFLTKMWGNMGFNLPGMVTPTLDVDELEKRIKDLRAVEGWLKMNLNTLQMTIQGLELQRATLAAVRTMSQPSSGHATSEAMANPFTNPAMWPWNLMQPASGGATSQQNVGDEQDGEKSAEDAPDDAGEERPRSQEKGSKSNK